MEAFEDINLAVGNLCRGQSLGENGRIVSTEGHGIYDIQIQVTEAGVSMNIISLQQSVS